MSRPTAITLRRLLFVVAATLLVAVVAVSAPSGLLHGLAYLLPPLLLLLALSMRRYPGERALLAVMEGNRGPMLDTVAEPVPRQLRRCPALPRGGRLIATSLAVRPPPARAAVSHA